MTKTSAEYQREWRAAHPDKYQEQLKKNREYSKKWHAEHPEYAKQRCIPERYLNKLIEHYEQVALDVLSDGFVEDAQYQMRIVDAIKTTIAAIQVYEQTKDTTDELA